MKKTTVLGASMTLGRQLLSSGMFLLICLFSGMLFYVVNNTQEFIDQQLAKHAEDTATSLGLSLSLAMEGEQIDLPTANRIIDAVWDSGYYRKIAVVNLKGETLIERDLQIKFYQVPNWFIQHLDLTTKEERAKIQSGWLQLGEIVVQSNPGFAYEQIWKTLIDFLKWLVVTFFLALGLGGVLLHIILKPLRAVTRQAVAICNQQFVEEALPWTIDLRQVVEAMNNMSRRLKRLFEDQAKVTEQLREQAFMSPVTKLGNRSYFDTNFDHLLADRDRLHSGVGLLIEVHDFKGYNDKFGYEAGDELLKEVANQIKILSVDIENALVAHLGGANFIIILSEKLEDAGIELAKKLCASFAEFKGKGVCLVSDVAHIGVSTYQSTQSKKDVLSQLDMALRKAQGEGPNVYFFLKSTHENEVHGAQDWAKIFDEVIARQQVVLHYQPIKLIHGESAGLYEILMRIKVEDKLLTAGIFMSMAERVNRIIALDQAMISTLFQRIETNKDQTLYFVNILPSSIDDADFVKWLLDKIKGLGKKAQQLIIELPEYGVVSRIDAIKALFLQVGRMGVKTSIDHYGKSLSSFAYLNNLRLNYLKIDGSFIRNIHENSDNQFLIRSLVEIARSLGITVIAEAVENEEEYKQLIELNVDGVQGYYIGKPTDKIS